MIISILTQYCPVSTWDIGWNAVDSTAWNQSYPTIVPGTTCLRGHTRRTRTLAEKPFLCFLYFLYLFCILYYLDHDSLNRCRMMQPLIDYGQSAISIFSKRYTTSLHPPTHGLGQKWWHPKQIYRHGQSNPSLGLDCGMISGQLVSLGF